VKVVQKLGQLRLEFRRPLQQELAGVPSAFPEKPRRDRCGRLASGRVLPNRRDGNGVIDLLGDKLALVLGFEVRSR
jgi:hypothetical protein